MGTCPILIAIPSSHWQGRNWNTTRADSEKLARMIGGTFVREISRDLYALPLSPRPTTSPPAGTIIAEALASHMTALNMDSPAAADTSYILLMPLFAGKHSTRARSALLRSKLVLKYRELLFLRSRSRFQNVVTFLQVAGYMMGIVLRIGEHLAISPLEAVLSLFCIQVLLQLVAAVFACSHYHRPLLLHLQPAQFSRLLQESESECINPRPSKTVKRCIALSGLVLGLSLLPAPILCYALSIRDRCHFCFFSALSMALLPLVSCLIMAALLLWCRAHWKPRYAEIWPPSHSLALPRLGKAGVAVSIGLIIILVLYLTGFLLAGMATHMCWGLFNAQTSYGRIKWILPHISSS